MRTDDVEQYRPVRSLLRRLIKAPTVFSILWPTLLIVGGYVGWHRWGSDHVVTQYFAIDPARIEITAPPEYIRSNIVQAVYHDTAMEGLSLLDRQATAKIASAFSMHPWVRTVTGVRKLPGGTIDVRLEYRSPVAMVHVFKPDPNDKGSYFYPVDGNGVLLPTSEFARSETRKFIHIEIPDPYANRLIGEPFGDARVEFAARLAAILKPYRDQVGIRSIGILGDPRQSDVPQFEITKLDGTKFPWGSPPGSELPREAPADVKLRSLLSNKVAAESNLRTASPRQSGNRAR
jgi:hypothetical protein